MTTRNPATLRPATAARSRLWLWLVALVVLAAGLASSSAATPTAKASGGAVLERAGFELAVPRPSAAPALERRGTAEDRSGGAEGADPAVAPPVLAALLDGGTGKAAPAGSPVAAVHARRRLPEARAPPA